MQFYIWEFSNGVAETKRTCAPVCNNRESGNALWERAISIFITFFFVYYWTVFVQRVGFLCFPASWRTKMSYDSTDILDDVEDPFKPRASLTHSPKATQKEVTAKKWPIDHWFQIWPCAGSPLKASLRILSSSFRLQSPSGIVGLKVWVAWFSTDLSHPFYYSF